MAEWLGPVVAAPPGIGSRQDGCAGVEGGLHIKQPEDRLASPPNKLFEKTERSKFKLIESKFLSKLSLRWLQVRCGIRTEALCAAARWHMLLFA